MSSQYILFISLLLVALVENKFVDHSTKLENGTITDDSLKKLLYAFNNIIGESQLISDEQIHINNSLTYLDGKIINGSAMFKNFNVPFAHVNMTTLEFYAGLSYQIIDLSGEYSLYIDNEWVHADSLGQFSINTTDLSSDIYLKLNLTKENTLQVEDVQVDYNVSVKVDIENLGGYQEVSDTLNWLMNYLMADNIIATKPIVRDEIKKQAIEMGNNFIFKDMTVEDLINDINSLIDSLIL